MKNFFKFSIITFSFISIIIPSFSFAQTNTVDYTCHGGSYDGFSTAGGSWDSDAAALAGCQSTCVGGTCSPSATNSNSNTTTTVTSTSSVLIPCGTIRSGAGQPVINPCGFNDLLTLINNVVKFILFVLAVPIAALMFTYAGFEMVTSGGSPEKATKAKNVFVNAAIGIAVVAASWLIVELVLSILGYNGSWIGF